MIKKLHESGGNSRRRVYVLMATGTAGFVVLQLGLPIPFNVLPAAVLSYPTQFLVLVLVVGLVGCAGLCWLRSSEPTEGMASDERATSGK